MAIASLRYSSCFSVVVVVDSTAMKVLTDMAHAKIDVPRGDEVRMKQSTILVSRAILTLNRQGYDIGH